MSKLLGIDTGGTYTDAVLLDGDRRVVASAKALTTRHDLTGGIGAVLAKLPAAILQDVVLVSLSTTLTTNSVVEGTGAPVCVLLPGYGEKQIQASGLRELLGADAVYPVSGGHDAMGVESAALDEAAIAQVIAANRDRVSAFAISALFGARNPAHEIRARALVTSLSGKPVTCGHELASSLGAPRRAMTAALNARMIPHIQHLIRSVQDILARLGIEAPLMMVKGDGSLINAETALQRPVGTVLSGPAASVVGACALSGSRNAIIADMGGTTTDIAVVTDGHPELDCEGALIGDWRPMVEAVRVYSVGLGGDSEVRVSGVVGLVIGPRRVVPLSLLCDQYPHILESLRRQLGEAPNPRHNRFVIPLQHEPARLALLGSEAQRAWEALAEGPLELNRVILADRPLGRAVGLLIREGLAIYSGFTPTDAAHVLGLSSHWCTRGASLAAQIWARQMRRIYGYGHWQESDPQAPCREVFERVAQTISRTLIEAGLHQHDHSAAQTKVADAIAKLILEPTQAHGDSPLFSLEFAAGRTLVAVGAPATSYYPEVAGRLRMPLQVPKHAEVANAVGAVMGSVVQRVAVTVSQPLRGVFRVYDKQGPRDFETLDSAIGHAGQVAAADARRLAHEAGADAIEVIMSQADNRVDHDLDGALFLDAVVTATASGRPRLAAATGTVDATE